MGLGFDMFMIDAQGNKSAISAYDRADSDVEEDLYAANQGDYHSPSDEEIIAANIESEVLVNLTSNEESND